MHFPGGCYHHFHSTEEANWDSGGRVIYPRPHDLELGGVRVWPGSLTLKLWEGLGEGLGAGLGGPSGGLGEGLGRG